MVKQLFLVVNIINIIFSNIFFKMLISFLRFKANPYSPIIICVGFNPILLFQTVLY